MREEGFYIVKKADFENYIDHWTISYWTVDHLNYSDSYWSEFGCSLTWKEDDYRYCEIGHKIELPKNNETYCSVNYYEPIYNYEEEPYELSDIKCIRRDESKILKEFYSEFGNTETTVKQRLDFANEYGSSI